MDDEAESLVLMEAGKLRPGGRRAIVDDEAESLVLMEAGKLRPGGRRAIVDGDGKPGVDGSRKA